MGDREVQAFLIRMQKCRTSLAAVIQTNRTLQGKLTEERASLAKKLREEEEEQTKEAVLKVKFVNATLRLDAVDQWRATTVSTLTIRRREMIAVSREMRVLQQAGVDTKTRRRRLRDRHRACRKRAGLLSIKLENTNERRLSLKAACKLNLVEIGRLKERLATLKADSQEIIHILETEGAKKS